MEKSDLVSTQNKQLNYNLENMLLFSKFSGLQKLLTGSVETVS